MEGGLMEKELVGSNPEQKNWRGILIAILVILVVLSLIVVAIILVSPKHEKVFIGESFTLEDMFDPKFKPRKFSANWIGDKNIYVYRNREGELTEYNVDLNTSTLIMNNSSFRDLDTDTYYVSEDLAYVLLAYDIEKVYRHSFKAKYKIFNRHAKNVKDQLVTFPSGLGNDWEHRKLQYAGWSATGCRLTFVYNNNLYYQADPYTTPSEVTTETANDIYNGIPDWLYEEEILHSNKAHWWSPEGNYIAYAKFDDRLVPKYEFPFYGDGSNFYGGMASISYPKAGDKGENVNPKVELYIVETSDPRVAHRQLLPPPEFQGGEFYVQYVVWADENTVLVAWLNRPQNVSIIRLCHSLSADCNTNLIEKTKGHGWISYPEPRFIENGQTYLTVLPGRDGSHGYWKHVAMVTAPSGQERGRKMFVTRGVFDVLELVGFDEEHRVVYYLGNGDYPRRRHLYSVALPGSTSHREPRCHTCELSPDCQYVGASFSQSAWYYILRCLGPGVPTYQLRSTRDDRAITVEDNEDVVTRLKKKALPVIEYHQILDPTESFVIWAKVLLPRTLTKDHILKYPVLVHTYAAPETQKVTEEFRLGWDTVLASSEQVVCVMADGRGASGRGNAWLHQLYKRLGGPEVEDQITAAKFFQKTMPYLDEGRMAIWGWSYGGFVTAHAIGDPSNVFPCGIAVAPVTDWRYYDTAYTERYMGLSNLEANFRGYDNSNVSRKAANFVGKNIMLVHGTADDNVHFQHTAQFTKALTAHGVDYRMQIYTDKDHELSGPKTSKHLYRTMTHYLKDTCWHGGGPLDPTPSAGEEKGAES